MALVTSAVIGAATGLAAMGMSFKQASDAAEMEAEGLAATDKLMEEAKKKAEIDYAQTLNVPLSAFGKEFDQNTANQNAIIQSLQEGDARNLAAGVGRVNVGTTDANENTRNALADRMYDLDKYQAEAKQTINNDQKDMLVGAAADKSQMSRDAAQAKTSAMQGAFQGLGQVAGAVGSLAPLYGTSADDRRADEFLDGLTPEQLAQTRIQSANPNPDSTLFNKYNTKGANYDPQKASLFAETIFTPMGRPAMRQKLLDQQYSKQQTQGFMDNKYADFDFSIFQ
tara:strand:+ start:1246 stop:2094 length:849 start_codon:yes stop_codon:yes gene_type:complete